GVRVGRVVRAGVSKTARSRLARWALTVEGAARPAASPISRTVGGYPCRSTYPTRKSQISCCLSVSTASSWFDERMFAKVAVRPDGVNFLRGAREDEAPPERGQCAGEDLNLHGLQRPLGPQPSAST